jgi:PAS domain S-box-containing protein
MRIMSRSTRAARAGAGISLALACLCFATSNAVGARTFRSDPEYLIDTWETEDGLPENSATAMVQTPEGYLWFGTFNGLVRFDGVRFTVFNRANTPELPSDGVVNLHSDRIGRLWVSTYRGLVVREGTQWRAFGTNDGWVGDLVRGFSERKNGDLLLTTFDGHVLEFANGRLAQLPPPPGRAGVGYLGFADEAGAWWVVQQWFVGSWDGLRWTEAASATKLFSQINGAGPARDGGLWLKVGSALCKLRAGKELARIPLPEQAGTPWGITEDSRGNVWIAAYDQGLSCVSPSGVMRRWTTTNGLSYNGTRFVFEDREENLWVGTSGGGLQRFKPRRFKSYGVESGLTERNVTSVSPDAAGGVWIATYGKGVFRGNGGAITNVPVPHGHDSLSLVNSVLADRAGRTWFGTWGQAVGILDARGFRRFPPEQTGGFNILSLFEDSGGRIWAGSAREVSVHDGGTFRLIKDESGAALSGIHGFAEDRNGVVWASNLENLFRSEKGRFIKVLHEGASLRDISSIKADADGTMWLGLQTGGLLCRRAGHFSRVNLGVGQPASGIHGIVEDAAGFFWMPSNRGVLRAARKDLLAATADGSARRVDHLLLDLADGLPSVECASARQPVCARDTLGRLWFATLKGVAMVDPADLRLNSRAPPVVIEQVSYRIPARGDTRSHRRDSTAAPLNGFSYAQGMEVRLSPPFHQPLQLPAGSRQIEIQYTALHFTAPEKVRFQTRIGNNGSDWEDMHIERLARFYEVPPGPMTFRVRAANNDGVWNEEGASIAFLIEPFFWQTWWFRIAAGFALLATGAAAAWLATHAKLRRAAERERAAQAMREIQERMDLAADAALLGMWVWDIPNNHIWATDRCKALYGYPSHGDMSYEALLVRVHPDDRDATEEAIARALAGEGRFEKEHRVLLPDGTTRWIDASGRAERNADGKLVQLLGVSIDITERKQAEHAARVVSGKLITAQEDERKRIARDLHDDLNQRLALLSVEMELLGQMPDGNRELSQQRIEHMAERVKEMSSDVHKMSYQLHPAKLDQLGLVAATRSFCRELSQQCGVRVEFLHDDLPGELDQDLALCFYRVTQESLQNMVKHSRATEVWVELKLNGKELRLAVSDNGVGFDVAHASRHGGLGLMGMRERMRLVQGTIALRSAPGHGARVEFTAPLVRTR